MHIGDYLGRRQVYSPDKLAIIDVGKQPALELTYRQLNERANRLAGWLRDVAGVQTGDRVAILARDGVEHLDLFYACGKLGAIHTPFNWRLHWRELAGLIDLTTPKALLFSDDFREAVAQIESSMANPSGTVPNGQRPTAGGQPSMADDPAKLPSPLTDHRSPITDHRLPFTIHHFLHLDGPGLPISHDYQSTLSQSQ